VRTEGGEALAVAEWISQQGSEPETTASVEKRPWLALWTHSHAEQLVYDQLVARGFDAFLPMIQVWSKRGGMRHLIPKPMFPGYLFVRHTLDKASYITILKTNGLARVLGERWDRPAIVADAEMEAVRQLLDAGLPILPYPYLREGHRVRITQGPLAGVEGVLLHERMHKGLLVVSVDLLQRSVAVEVDCVVVAPAGGPVLAHAASLAARPASSAR
jgi:transcription antitermination factor NusG